MNAGFPSEGPLERNEAPANGLVNLILWIYGFARIIPIVRPASSGHCEGRLYVARCGARGCRASPGDLAG